MLATLCALIAVASLSWGYPIRRGSRLCSVVLAFLSVVVAELVPHVFGAEAAGWRTGLSWSAVAIVAITVGVGYLFHGNTLLCPVTGSVASCSAARTPMARQRSAAASPSPGHEIRETSRGSRRRQIASIITVPASIVSQPPIAGTSNHTDWFGSTNR